MVRRILKNTSAMMTAVAKPFPDLHRTTTPLPQREPHGFHTGRSGESVWRQFDMAILPPHLVQQS
jgi:hypothetical protein